MRLAEIEDESCLFLDDYHRNNRPRNTHALCFFFRMLPSNFI